MLKKLFINCLFLFLILIFICTNMCYATPNTVTDKNLSEAIQKFILSDANKENYKISVANNIINITVNDQTYTLNYNLTNKPTFSLEIPIQKGMSYDDFKEKTDNLGLHIIGYIAVANIQGVDFEDSSAYFLMSYLGNTLNGSWSSENSYVIVDDTNMTEGVTIDKDESDTKTIYTSEFGERVMEYVNATYKDKQTIKDSSDGINSYEWTTERKDVTNTSCKLVSSISIDLNADFSKLNGYSNQIGESFLNKDITKENADYAITLKVGQKCRIETTEKITGHELSGSGYEYNEINENYAEIIGKRVGKANGYIRVGETKKSIFITVEENTENTPLDTITLNIDSKIDSDKENTTNEEKNNAENENDELSNNVSNTETLPYSGIENNLIVNILYLIIGIALFTIVILIILNKNKRKNK